MTINYYYNHSKRIPSSTIASRKAFVNYKPLCYIGVIIIITILQFIPLAAFLSCALEPRAMLLLVYQDVFPRRDCHLICATQNGQHYFKVQTVSQDFLGFSYVQKQLLQIFTTTRTNSLMHLCKEQKARLWLRRVNVSNI